MKKITLKEFWSSKENLAIHCKTEEQANKLLKAFDKFGQKWISGRSYLVDSHWDELKEEICYDNQNIHGPYYVYEDDNYKIYEFEDVDLGA